ncbi:MAG: acyl-homoserine-lactone synthase [Pannonibacter sp.]
MFKLITPEMREGHRDLIDAMHEMRYRVVVCEWGWDIPGVIVGYEADQFDTAETVYVIVQNDDGEVVASARLNPTTQPHMLSELFADYCDLQPWPVGADVWECSRFVTERSKMPDPVEDFRARCRLGLGLTIYCIDHQITRLSWLTHQKFYNLVQKVWTTEPLGLPRRNDDDWAWIPAVSTIDAATLDRQLDRYRNAETIVAAYMSPKLAARAGRVA